jgi:hypothetical protein
LRLGAVDVHYAATIARLRRCYMLLLLLLLLPPQLLPAPNLHSRVAVAKAWSPPHTAGVPVRCQDGTERRSRCSIGSPCVQPPRHGAPIICRSSALRSALRDSYLLRARITHAQLSARKQFSVKVGNTRGRGADVCAGGGGLRTLVHLQVGGDGRQVPRLSGLAASPAGTLAGGTGARVHAGRRSALPDAAAAGRRARGGGLQRIGFASEPPPSTRIHRCQSVVLGGAECMRTAWSRRQRGSSTPSLPPFRGGGERACGRSVSATKVGRRECSNHRWSCRRRSSRLGRLWWPAGLCSNWPQPFASQYFLTRTDVA